MSINVGDLLGKLGGGGGSGSGGDGGSANLLQSLLPAILPLLAGGGLTKILGGLQSKGLTSQVDSWTGDGANEAISASQVKDALDDDTLDEVAQKAGVSTDEAADGISKLLPKLVDSLSPNGSLPDQNDLGSVLGSLSKQLGG